MPVPEPRIEVTPTSWDFGDAELGSTQTLDIVIENTGDAPLTVTNIEMIEGADLGFGLQDPFGGELVLDPGDSTIVTVVYTPLSLGASEGRLRIESNAGDVDVDFNGVGVPVPVSIEVTPGELVFGQVLLGESRELVLTISNPSGGDLSVSDIRVSEGADVGFTLSEPFAGPVDVAPGSEFSVTIVFTPLDTGEVVGSVEIDSNADEGLVTVRLSGTGGAQPAPLIDVEPADEVDFANVELEQTGSVTLTISNTGNADLTLDRVSVPEGADVGFALDGGPIEDEVVAPGDALEVIVTFTPVEAGLVTGLFRVESNAENEPVVERALSGTGTAIPLPVVTVTPEQVGFGEVDIGDEATAEVRIENIGDADLTVEDVLIAEGAGAGFSVTGVPSEPTVLAPGEALTVTAGFSPVAEGPVNGTLSVISDASNGAEQLVSLQGTGVEPPAPGIEVGPQNLNFGEVSLGEEASLNFTISNPGDAVLELAVTLESSAGGGVFTLDNTPSEVAASDEASVTVTFRPSVVGEVRATVRITSNADPGEITVEVRGTGTGVPELRVSPSSLDFGEVRLGETSTETVRLENTGTGPLQLGVEINGDATFTVETGLGDGTLAPGETLTLEIAYRPTAVGESQASLDISSDGGNESVSLRGNGLPAPEPRIDVSPPSVGFGDVEVGETVTTDITIENTGNAVLRITEIVLTGDSSDDLALEGGVTDGRDVAPGDRLVVTVRFTPTSPGDASGGVRIVSNATNDDTIVVDIDGTGVPRPVAEIDVTPTNIDFGNISVGDSGMAEVRIQNTGTSTLNVDALVLSGDTADFAVDDNTTGLFVIEPGEDVVVIVMFTPGQAGEASATLEISSNANETLETTVGLRGEGVVAVIDVQPSSLSFDPQEIGQSQTLSIEVTNDGLGDLDLTSVSIDEPSFELGAVPVSVAPGTTETIEVTFRPDRDGDILGELTMDNNSENEPQVVVGLSGTGIVPAGARLFVESTELTFGETAIDEPVSLSVTVRSVGLADVTISRLELGVAGEFVLGDIPGLPVTLAPGETTTIEIVFAPTVPGPFSDLLLIESDDENDPLIDVPLNGMGVEAMAAPGLETQ